MTYILKICSSSNWSNGSISSKLIISFDLPYKYSFKSLKDYFELKYKS